MDNKDVITAYNQQCIDDHNYSACQAYTVTINNKGDEHDYSGTIDFGIDHIENLYYMLLDENDEVYMDATKAIGETDQSLGEAFTLAKDGTRTFKLIIWLSNLEEDQFEYDGNGSYNASITYASTMNSRITGSISGS